MIAALPSSRGMIAEEMYVPVGVIGLFGTSDEGAVMNVVDDFTDYVSGMGISPEEITAGDATGYEVKIPFTDSPVGVYGVGGGYLSIVTSGDLFEGIYGGSGENISENPVHKDVWSAFPGGSVPVLYIDVDGVASFLRSNADDLGLYDLEEGLQYADPVSAVAMGVEPLNADGYATGSIIVFITE